jgi:hypothetical protein
LSVAFVGPWLSLVSIQFLLLAENTETGIEINEFFKIWGTGARGIASRGSNPAAPTIKRARRRETGRRVFCFAVEANSRSGFVAFG